LDTKNGLNGGVMTVYIEYVLIDNFLIDYALLKCTFLIMGKQIKRLRLILCALLGSIIALVYPLISGVAVLSTIIKILTGLLLTLLSAKYNGIKDYFYCTLLFFLLTFLAGGTVIGVMQILGLNYSTKTFIAIGFLPALLIIKGVASFIKELYKRKGVMKGLYPVEMQVDGYMVKTNGFMDTGNNLYYNNAPCIVCGKAFFKRIIKGVKGLPKLEKISVKTVTGKGQMTLIKLSALKIYYGDKWHIHNSVNICVSPNFRGVGYDVILHPDLLEVNDEKFSTIKVKKVS